MGLHLCYELSLPADATQADANSAMQQLRERALGLPFDEVSALVVEDKRAMVVPPRLRGLRYESLEDVMRLSARLVRDALYGESLGEAEGHVPTDVDGQRPVYPPVTAPDHLPVTAIGFAIDPGRGSEPAAFGLVRLRGPECTTRWWWHFCCKTQYASIISNEHLVRCHAGLVSVLDAASSLGLELDVRDEAGYWPTRSDATLIANVAEMNRVVAALAGGFTDVVRAAGGDSRAVDGAIFAHPEFERLETEGGAGGSSGGAAG